MTAGLPGTGIGGMFYLLSAILMPVHEFFMLLLGRSKRKNWKIAFKQAAIASIILIAMWFTGFFLARLAHLFWKGNAIAGAGRTSNVIRLITIYFSLAILGAVLLAIQILGIIANYKGSKFRKEYHLGSHSARRNLGYSREVI